MHGQKEVKKEEQKWTDRTKNKEKIESRNSHHRNNREKYKLEFHTRKGEK